MVYPASFSCFENYSWSLSLAEVDKMSLHYESCSKGGKTPISRVENQIEYIKELNWFSNWVDIYFFNKVSDFILGLVVIIIFIILLFYKKKTKFLNVNKNIYFVLAIIFFFFIEWFYNHPSLRYGGYCLIVILIFLPFSFVLQKYDNSIKEMKHKFISVILIVFLIFFTRNIFRIQDEMTKYSYKPLTSTFYLVDETHFRIDTRLKELIKNFEECKKNTSDCKFDLLPEINKLSKNSISL